MEPEAATAGDAGLVLAIAQGDRAAEAELYGRFSARVFYFARRELRSADLAEDARSETFLRVLQTIRKGGMRTPESLTSFVLQTTRRVVYEIIRKRTRGHDGVDPAQLDAFPATPPPDVIDPAVVESVRETLNELSDRDRQFLKMHYYDERPKNEIALKLGVDEERVRLIKSRALQRFRQAYQRRAEAS